MEFCQKCGSIMLPKKIEGAPVLVCSGCGYATKAIEPEKYKLAKLGREREAVAVIEKEIKPTLPTTRTRCPKCGHGTAYWWLVQTRGADEPSTRFYRCVKCSHTWREYS